MRNDTPPVGGNAGPSQPRESRHAQYLSHDRAPAEDIAPWIARLFVARFDESASERIECGLFADIALFSIMLRGDCTAQTVIGPMTYTRSAVFCGPSTQLMPISISGDAILVGLSPRPGAGTAMRTIRVGDYLDQIIPSDVFTMPSDQIISLFDLDASPEEWLNTLENLVRLRAEQSGWAAPDPISTQFEKAAFLDPSVSVAAIAKNLGVERRRLERIVSRDFGLPPKQVLRRARALDMASHLRGVADKNEAEEAALRYYDESHLIKEFVDLFRMTPRQFAAKRLPIFTRELEARQARRLEMLERLSPGEIRPWRQTPGGPSIEEA